MTIKSDRMRAEVISGLIYILLWVLAVSQIIDIYNSGFTVYLLGGFALIVLVTIALSNRITYINLRAKKEILRPSDRVLFNFFESYYFLAFFFLNSLSMLLAALAVYNISHVDMTNLGGLFIINMVMLVVLAGELKVLHIYHDADILKREIREQNATNGPSH